MDLGVVNNIHETCEWHEISAIEFGFLTTRELRRVSVVQIDNPAVYNSDKRANRRSLYDPVMGVCPKDKDLICETCGFNGLECPGHPGHIQLLLPTYNPILIDVLVKLLKTMCLHCHRLRIRSSIKESYTVIFKLLHQDKVMEALAFHQCNLEAESRKLEKLSLEGTDENGEEIQNLKFRISQGEQIKVLADKISKSEKTSTSIQLFNEFLKILEGLVQKKCPNQKCLRQARKVKKEGANKIFINEVKDVEKIDPRKSESRKSETKRSETETPQVQPQKKVKYVNPKQVYNYIKKLWKNDSQILGTMYGNTKKHNPASIFFLNAVFVPPSRFRPQSVLGEQKYLHDHTSRLCKIVQSNADIKHLLIDYFVAEETKHFPQNIKQAKVKQKKEQLKNVTFSLFKKLEWFSKTIRQIKSKPQFINRCLQLQDNVNCLIDASRASKMADRDSKGIRQILERKQGLFRMKMMGKRVNFAARSVISPDPSLSTDQVGVPVFMAKKLTFPQYVNENNIQALKQHVINGSTYPGATFVQESGNFIRLDSMSAQQRISQAQNLQKNYQNKIVHRHLLDGDPVLFNRQPSLHKASLMTHHVKVLPKESTLRMNYANCKSYNADFDGDEMNMHALQNSMAKAQAELFVSDQLFQNSTNGKPQRQIIQDAIVAAVYLSMRDTFLPRSLYQQLLYQATFSLFNELPRSKRLFLLSPAICKPVQLWTGKQLISNVIRIVVDFFTQIDVGSNKGLCMRSKARVDANNLVGYEEECNVRVVNNELLQGILDKNQLGAGADYGLMHSFNELYGEKLTGILLTALNKLFLNYMQVHGFTCGLDDLMLKKKTTRNKIHMIRDVHRQTVLQICKTYQCIPPLPVDYYGRSAYLCDQDGNYLPQQEQCHLAKDKDIVVFLENKLRKEPETAVELDAEYKHHLVKGASEVIKQSVRGLSKQFPLNNFSMMTLTGAKGSKVNHSQVSILLQVQELEGRRVPVMISGKTLPSFIAYDPNPRASGFVGDCFLTGLREQQFYFHCMAGREGLIDTAVKTSRSGYLQRCLMKHLQSLKVQYDYTVRDCDGTIIQFLYGEDCLNPAKDKFFHRVDFLQDNVEIYSKKYKMEQFAPLLKTEQIVKYKRRQSKRETILERYPPATNLGTMSQECFDRVRKLPLQIKQLYGLKYKYNMVEPGQAVGCVAAQSIGEPSTQMTLNTFHLAGHGGVNLTLGIPRLRQLLMTSSKNIKTPMMELHFLDYVDRDTALYLTKQMERVTLNQLIKTIDISEWNQFYRETKLLSPQDRKRYYEVTLHYEQEKYMMKEYNIGYRSVEQTIVNNFILRLIDKIKRVKTKSDLKTEVKRNKEEEEGQDVVERKQSYSQMQEEQVQERMEQEKEQKKQKIVYQSQYLKSYRFDESRCIITLKVPLGFKRILMSKLISQLLRLIVVKETKGIDKAVLSERKDVQYIQTQGVNFKILKQFSFLNLQKTYSNDIHSVSNYLGIEAARTILIKEIVSLFAVYGVSVDYRHLYLIGDFFTFGGMIRAANRNWMNQHSSPLLRMTFQTSVKFLTAAALHNEVDYCKSPSSKIILGQCPIVGTGMCDLLPDN